MALPWLQIVQLVPSIVDVSRELLRRTKRPVADANVPAAGGSDAAARLAALEENERRQAELVSQMAEQIGKLTQAIMLLHKQVRWLWVALAIASAVAIIALWFPRAV